jgi:phosphocarrier protein
MPQEEQPVATRRVVVREPNGLHMRPAESVARTAMRFEATITLTQGDHRVDAKSIFDLITLAAEEGTELDLRAEGSDADAAAETLATLFENKFETPPSPGGEPPAK